MSGSRSPSACERRLSRAGAGLVALALLGGGLPAQAAGSSDKQACSKAYVDGQRLRNSNKLIEASKQFLVCSRDVCPAVLRKDCIRWSAGAEQAIPTVVVEASDASGGDLVDVSVTLDDEPFVFRIDGSAKPVDPGVHTFRFETQGAEPIEKRVVVHTADKNRHIHVTFPIGGEKAPAPEEQPKPPEQTRHDAAPAHDKGSTPPAVYVLGGVGVVSLGVFSYMALKFNSQLNDLDKCKGHCSQRSVDSANRTRNLSYIPLGIGVVSLAVAAGIYFSGSNTGNGEQAAKARFDVQPVRGGAVTTLGGRF